jgi:hypothetical protein
MTLPIPSNFTPGNPALDPTSAIFYGIVAILLIILADYVPWLVNGLLAVILLGLILRNNSTFQTAINRGVGAATGGR